jgi:serine/threonine-protein kinase
MENQEQQSKPGLCSPSTSSAQKAPRAENGRSRRGADSPEALVGPAENVHSSPPSRQAWLATQVTEGAEIVAVREYRRLFPATHVETPALKPPTFRDFQLLETLGEGAMGTVYKAYQISSEREVALKVLFPHMTRNPKLVERFYREARTMGRLDHPNIVRGYAVGAEQGWHYFAMEYVDGRSLQEWLIELDRLPVADAVQIALACARALQYVHELNLVHRDIKPDNVLITNRGMVKLTDLGVVKLADEDLSLTQTGHSVGTPCYMSPEQTRNAKDADGRSDIYALGCMLYCMLAGQPPFTGATVLELMQAKEAGRFLPVRRANPAVPKRLEFIIEKMVAKQARYRYQTCAELIKDLQSLELNAQPLSFLPRENKGPVETHADDVAPPSTDLSRPAKNSDDAESDWYICYQTSDSTLVTEKMTTSQVLELIANEDFDLTAKASRNLKDGFRALACFREFEPGFLSRVAKTAVDRKTTKFRTLYKKLEQEDCERQRERFRQNPPQLQKAVTWPLIVYWFASRAVLVYVAFVLLRFLITGIWTVIGF